jgi:hypothetical protein
MSVSGLTRKDQGFRETFLRLRLPAFLTTERQAPKKINKLRALVLILNTSGFGANVFFFPVLLRLFKDITMFLKFW